MNSLALIGSPGAVWIYAHHLFSRGRRVPPASGLAWGSGRGAWDGGKPQPAGNVAGTGSRILEPCSEPPAPRSPGAYLPAPGSRELPRRPRRP